MKKYLSQQGCSRRDEVSVLVQTLRRCEQDGIRHMELDLDRVRLEVWQDQDGRTWVEITVTHLALASAVRERIFERLAERGGHEAKADDGIVFRFFLNKQ